MAPTISFSLHNIVLRHDIPLENLDDCIEVRQHVYVTTGYDDSVESAEVRPRMTMRMFEIRSGTLENKYGDVGRHLAQYIRTSRKKNYLSEPYAIAHGESSRELPGQENASGNSIA
jgi:U3 small nucleolar ribonucleoprotein protein IMP4